MTGVDDAEACIAIALALHDDELLAASVAALREAEGGVSGTSGFSSGHLYWVSPPTDAEDPIAAHAAMGAIAASAIEQHGIGRVVFQSSVGAERRSGTGEIDGLAATELALDATGASVLHLRCGMFFTNLLMDPRALENGVLRVTLPIDLPLPWVDPRDIGDVAFARLLSPTWARHQVQAVHGPADLSYQQIAAILGEATGRPMAAAQIPDEDLRAALRDAGMGERQVEAMVGMSIGVREDFVPADPRTVLTTTPTTLRAWAHEHLR